MSNMISVTNNANTMTERMRRKKLSRIDRLITFSANRQYNALQTKAIGTDKNMPNISMRFDASIGQIHHSKTETSLRQFVS